MYVINYKEREETTVTMPGAEKTTVRWLVGRKTGATTYAMRYFEIQPGGIVPEHSHQEEHEIFVLRGEAKLIGDCDADAAKKDDVLYIPPDFPHGYDNTEGAEPFAFICVIPLLDQE
ncbi:MAG: cupin domain-containing protein [Candidatus Hermodarchaeota archaeon]